MSNNREVPVEFTGRRDHVSERMSEHAVRKLSKLARYNDRITRIEIIADHAHESPEIELIAHLSSGPPMVAKEQGDTFSTTIDILVEKMEKRLRKAKDKFKSRRSDTGKGSSLPGPDSADGPEETYDDVVRRDLKS